MPIPAGDEAVDLLNDRATGAPANRRRRPLKVGHRLPHCLLVRVADRNSSRGVAGAEEHAHALGCRERQVIGRDLDPARPIAERLPGPRVQSSEQRTELLACDRTAEAKPGCCAPGPRSEGFTALAVVVLDPTGHALDDVDARPRLIQVVAGLVGGELRDREHLRGQTVRLVLMQKAVHTLMSDVDRRPAVESGLDVIGGSGLHVQMTARIPAAGCWSSHGPRPARTAVVCVWSVCSRRLACGPSLHPNEIRVDAPGALWDEVIVERFLPEL
jgi:hypothetical protein